MDFIPSDSIFDYFMDETFKSSVVVIEESWLNFGMISLLDEGFFFLAVLSLS